VFASGYEVVNADSKQIYRHLDIGSAKPDPALLHRIPHHLIDIREPWEQFSVGDFVKLADVACSKIVANGNIPIICGGTAYYFKHFYFGLPHAPKSDPKVRAHISELAQSHGLAWCHKRLQEVDPISAEKIHPADAYRITRALEVYETAGKPLSSFSLPTVARNGINPLIIGLHRDRDELERRIETRVDSMFEQGLEAEFNHLVSLGATPEWPGMQGIGYREFFVASEHKTMKREDIAKLIVRNSRMYAKRQMTFFRSLPHVHWVHPDNREAIRSLIAKPIS
jgi:tRNA dimethylallyltransferase